MEVKQVTANKRGEGWKVGGRPREGGREGGERN